MRRSFLLQLKMEVQQEQQQQNNSTLLLAHLANSQFAKKLLLIPMFKAAVDTAGDAYVKVKDSNALVSKSIELALNISVAVVDKLAPIAEKGISAASPLTTKVDEIAAKSLDELLARVPVINEQPKEIVQTTKTALERRVSVIGGYTEAALKTWPVQSAMDVYETILTAAYNTMETVLPGEKDAATAAEQNGSTNSTSTKESLGEQDKHKRGLVLAQRTYLMFTTAFRRVFGIAQQQMGNAAQATDLVYQQVRNAIGDNNSSSKTNASTNTTIDSTSTSSSPPPPQSTPASTAPEQQPANNGDSNKAAKKGKSGNKKHNQEQQ